MAENTPPDVPVDDGAGDREDGREPGGTLRGRVTQGAMPLVALFAAGSVIAAAVVSGAGQDRSGRSWPPDPGSGTALVALTGFDGCAEVLEHFRSRAARSVTPWGVGGAGSVLPAQKNGDLAAGSGSDAPARQETAGAGTVSGSGTNVQVSGVDEADLAKRSGDLLITVAGEGGLRILRTSSTGTTPLARLPLDGWSPENLLVRGDTVLVMGTVPATGREPAGGELAYVRGSTGRLAQIDVSTPARPALVRTLDVDGSLTGARLVDGTARIAVTADPTRLRTTLPSDGTRQARERALAANREAVDRSTVDMWLPQYTLRGSGGAVERTGTAVACDAVSAPGDFAGLSTLSLLSFDLSGDAGVAQWESAAVIARGSTLYATADHTWVATSSWNGVVSGEGTATSRDGTASGEGTATDVAGVSRTQIHLFDTAGRSAPEYVASGQVPGTLLNQFSLDEHDGHLRVATTTRGRAVAVDEDDGSGSAGTAPPSVPDTSSQVSVLRRDGDRLRRVGGVGGLGRGEQIRSVRFLGGLGYVVTFRRTDPLHVVDLRTPTAPRVTGELRIPGYSGYLHPASEGTLLGVGQDADADGRTEGLQLSLFDVSDPASPRRVDRTELSGAWSEVENDHHAFTLAGGLALVPFRRTVPLVLPPPAATPVPLPTPTARVPLGTPTARIPLRTAPDDPASQDSGDLPGTGSSGTQDTGAGAGTAAGSSATSSAAPTPEAVAPAAAAGSPTRVVPVLPTAAPKPSGDAGDGTADQDPGRSSAMIRTVRSGLLAVRSARTGLGEPVVLYPTSTGRAAGDGRSEAGDGATPLRSYVADGALWVLTADGVATFDARRLAFRGFTAF